MACEMRFLPYFHENPIPFLKIDRDGYEMDIDLKTLPFAY
jgi:hypothetical protein